MNNECNAFRPVENRPIPRQASRGLTLVELVVVLGIAGLLAAILIPSVQSAREAGRRLQCASNLHEIGLAMQQYDSVHGMFPPTQLLSTTRVSANRMSELTFILPYLDNRQLYASVNMAFANTESATAPSVENRTARNTNLAVFLCPSDVSRAENLNSYRFNRGRYRGADGNSPGFDGPFSIGVLPSQKTVTDGLSNTAFVSQRVCGTFSENIIDEKRNIKNPVMSGELITSDFQFIPYCLSAPLTFGTSPRDDIGCTRITQTRIIITMGHPTTQGRHATITREAMTELVYIPLAHSIILA